MRAFLSRKQFNEDAVKHIQRRYRTLAKTGNPDLALSHPDWVRDANKKQYTVMDAKIKEMVLKGQEDFKVRRTKLVTK